MKKLKRYKLIKEYNNSPKLETIIEECYSVPYQYVNQTSSGREIYHQHELSEKYWERISDKQIIITH